MTRLIADVMLGSLARWLRILGYDTIYFRAIDDNELIKTARQQERILLTRDTGIAHRKHIQQLILVRSNAVLEQLEEVLSALKKMNRTLPRLSSRCALCNGELAASERDAVSDRIPEYVFLNAASFFTCRECGKVYWCGSHKKSIDSRLQQIISEK
ncbi:MAG TPA: Mut7-C RNAse domain-containing protein [Dissulfurispiraceae bacterium]|nr:Mut7-C RNAse domain-containing protein [Dissulfurispiraceae bacterium]